MLADGFPISPNDEMFGGNLEHYRGVGRSAVNCVERVLATTGQPPVRSILDLPCGHGRVARALRVRFPDAAMSVSDLNEDGVEFCARTFGATALKSSPDFDALNFGERFDLIWVGSLITHLSSPKTEAFLRFALRHLSPRGVAVVSSHGAFVLGLATALSRQGAGAYGLDAEALPGVLHDAMTTGYGYGSYPWSPGYGVSFISKSWLEDAVIRNGGRPVYYADLALDQHHDVIGFTLP